MNINQIAKLTQLTPKAIRFYEEKGLITAPDRATNGYRQYHQQHIKELNLIHHARCIGFSLAECQQLLRLYRDPHRRSAEVKQYTLAKIENINQQITKLLEMKNYLKQLAEQCPGDNSENCPIINHFTCCIAD